VIVPAALLTALLLQHTAPAAPDTLTAALGKMAVSGVGGTMVSAPAVPGFVLVGKLAAGLVVVAVLLGGGIYLMPHMYTLRATFIKPTTPRAAMPAPAIASTPSSALATANWQASLPNGTQVTLVGVTIPPVDKHRWWAPDGALLAQDPIPEAGEGIIHRGRSEDRYRRVVFRFSSEPQQKTPSVTARWKPEESLERTSDISYSRIFAIVDLLCQPDRPFSRATTIYLGMADSPWEAQQITLCADGVFTNTRTTDALHAITVQNIGEYGPGVSITHCEVAVTYPSALEEKEALRVFAYDTHGKRYPMASSSTPGYPQDNLPEMVTTRFRFDDLKPEQAAKVQFETRPYTWLKFTDVALEPTAH